MIFEQRTYERAAEILREARADLGADLGGLSPADLLLDNLPELPDSAHARALVALVDGQVFSRSAR